MSAVEFQGVTYLRADLPDGLLAYIDAYNQSLAASQTPLSDTNDYSFRMSQALQMFGEPAVVAAIEDVADSFGIDLR
jgi:hypothetical protein